MKAKTSCRALAAFGASCVLAGLVVETASASKLGALPRHADIVRAAPDRIIERAPGREATLHADVRAVLVETGIVWKPICGSNLKQLTPPQFEQLVRDVIARRPKEQDEPQAEAGRGAGLNIVFNVTNSPGAAANTAIAQVEAYLESLFHDPVTVTIAVDFQNMGGGVLGATGSNFVSNVSYSTIRANLQSDMDGDDFIEGQIPGGSTVPVRYNGSSSTVTNENVMDVNTANYEAFIGSVGGTDASMTLNNAFPWDYDPSNGVGGAQWDFQGVMVHEVGHALGFVSAADFTSPFMELLDLYRFQRTDGAGDFNPDGLADFPTTARLVDFNTPNDDHNSVLYDSGGAETEYRMADGSPDQASHFREQSPPIGLMDPAAGSGENFWPDFYDVSDMRMLDAIGWDLIDEGGTTTLPFSDTFPSASIDGTKWTGNDGASVDGGGSGEPSGTLSLHLDNQDALRSAFIDTSAIASVFVSYWWQKAGTQQAPEAGDDLVVEYFNNSNAWVEIARHPGSGPTGQPYAFESFSLSGDALHDDFRIQIRTEGNDSTDDWFVDDVGIDQPAANDSCASATVLSPAVGSHPISNLFASSNGFTEPCADLDSDVWYRIVSSCEGTLTISICDADFDSELALYGAGCPGGPNLAIACSDDDCGTGSSISVSVAPGLYRIRVGGKNGEQGTGTLVIDCAAEAIGACCFANGSCSETTSTDCGNGGGTYEGDGTDCSPNPCPQPTGACCFANGSCTEDTSADCATAGGAYEGDGTECSPNPCAQPTGACCFDNGSCTDVTSADCGTAGGVYQGNGTDCSPNPCPQPAGACCNSDGTCDDAQSPTICANSGGVYQGDDSLCSGVSCPQPCPEDIVPPGGDGQVTIADVTAVLTAFGLPCGGCPEDVAPPGGDGQVTIADVTAVLAAFGPCNP